MRKRILPIVLVFSMALPVTAFAGNAEWHIDRTVTVKEGTELVGADAPKVVIEAHSDFKDDFSFELELENAEWLYGNSGDFSNGISYMKFADDWMIFEVDADVYEPDANSISIPLYCKVLDGEATVKLTCNDYIINKEDEDNFAKTPTGEDSTVTYKDGTKELNGIEDELGTIIIEEHNAKSFKAGESYELRLSNGFEFKDYGNVKGTGDFAQAHIFQYLSDSERLDRVEVKFTQDLKEPSGKLIFTDMVIRATGESNYSQTDMLIRRDGDTYFNAEVKLGTYGQTILSSAPLEITYFEMDKEEINVRGTGGPGKKVRVYVGGSLVGETIVNTKGTWAIERPFEGKLENGLYLVETGYYSASTDKFTQVIKKDVDIKYDVISFKVGESVITTNGVKKEIDAKLYIDKNDRMMVPMRALLNALGIEDNDIKWNDSLKSVTVNKGARIIEVYAGSKTMKINGVDVEMNTEAVISDGRTYLPLRDICVAVGNYDIAWNDGTKTVTITEK